MSKLTSTVAPRKIRVVTAVQLAESDKNAITKKLKSNFSDSDGVEFIVDKEIIAGIKIIYGDSVYEDTPLHNISQNKI